MVVLMDISSRCARTSCVSNFGQVVPLCILGYFISWNNPTKVGFYYYPNFLSNEHEEKNDNTAGQTTKFPGRESIGLELDHVVIMGDIGLAHVCTLLANDPLVCRPFAVNSERLDDHSTTVQS